MLALFLSFLLLIRRREIWKYGERGFRYSQLDVGHALSSLSVSALLLGWQVIPINLIGTKFTDNFLEKFLNLNTYDPSMIRFYVALS
jgi:hypothetical protein